MIIFTVVYGDDIFPNTRAANGVVVDKGYVPPYQINDQCVLDEYWWVDVYDEKEQRTGRIYLNQSIWAKTHVGNNWTHGLEEYD